MNWQQAIKQAIDSIPFAPYSQRGGQNGVTEDIYWQGTKILRSGDPPASHCSGALCESTLKAFKLLELENIIPVHDIIQFKEHGFVYDEETQFDAYPGALVALGWGNWIGTGEVQYGDLAQLWHEKEESRINGHSVILTGIGDYDGKPVFNDWSATPLAPLNGHGYDWHLIDRTVSSGHQRVWYIARPDIEQIKNKY